MSAPQLDASPETDLGSLSLPPLSMTGTTNSYPREIHDDVATVTELHPATETGDTRPIPLSSTTVSDQHMNAEPDHTDPERDPDAELTAARHRAAPPPAASSDPPQEPTPTPLPDKPRFVGADMVDMLFYASIAFSAIGQIMFWGSFFQVFAANAFPAMSTTIPWVVALVLGGVMEAGMIVFTDLGFDRRDGKSTAWISWFLVGVAIAGGCIAINVGHWWGDDPTAAITFGAVGAIGFTAHLAKGLNKSQEYIDERRAIDHENQRRREHYEQQQRRHEAAIEREREHRRRLELQHAPTTSSATSATTTPPSKPATKDKSSTPKRKAASGKPQLDRETAVTWARANGAGAQRTRQHFQDTYQVPSGKTIQRWINAV